MTVDTLTPWVDEHRSDPLIAYLIEHHTATLAELAAVGNFSIERVAADMGGLHDYGIVTKYGNNPWSMVAWVFDMHQRWAHV